MDSIFAICFLLCVFQFICSQLSNHLHSVCNVTFSSLWSVVQETVAEMLVSVSVCYSVILPKDFFYCKNPLKNPVEWLVFSALFSTKTDVKLRKGWV